MMLCTGSNPVRFGSMRKLSRAGRGDAIDLLFFGV